MARTGTQVNVEVSGDIGPLDQRDLANSDPLNVAVVDGSGDQITGGFGGTEFDDGDTIDTTSQGKLIIGTTGISGTARAIRTNDDGLLLARVSSRIVGITTSILAGARTYVNNPSGGQAVNIQDGGNSITVDGTVTATVASTSIAGLEVDIQKILGVAIDTNSGNKSAATQRVVIATDQPNVPVNLAAATTSVLAGTRVYINNPSGGQAVNIQDGGNSITVDGTVTATVTSTTLAGLQISGKVADDAVNSGFPVMQGGVAKSFDATAPGNISAENDIAYMTVDPNRRQYVNTVHPQYWSYHTDVSLAITDKTIQAAPGDGSSVFVTDIVFSCSSTVVGARLFFEEGTTKVLGPYYLEAVNGRGMAIHFNTPKRITNNTALTITSPEVVAKTIDICGFVAKT